MDENILDGLNNVLDTDNNKVLEETSSSTDLLSELAQKSPSDITLEDMKNGVSGAVATDSSVSFGLNMNMDENLFSNYGEQETIDNIFAAIIVGGVNPKTTDVKKKADTFHDCINLFLGTFKHNIFKNEYAILYSIIAEARIKTFSLNQLETIIINEADKILDSQLIDLNKYGKTITGGTLSNEEKLAAFSIDLKNKFVYLSNKVVTKDEYTSSANLFIEHFKNAEMIEITADMGLIMSVGLRKKLPGKRKTEWKGQADANEYYMARYNVIKALDAEDVVNGTVIDENWVEKENERDKYGNDEQIMDTGIEEIDSVHGKLCRGNILECLGPTKGGKTTFATYLVERALKHGLNVAVWPLEGETSEWTSLIQACMIRQSSGMYISKKDIHDRNYSGAEQMQAVMSSRVNLAMNPDRGNLSFITGALYCETFMDELDTHYEKFNAFDILVIDSPVLALSLTGRSKVDRIGETYTQLKNYVTSKMKRKALAIVTAQMKQEAIKELRAHPENVVDITAGGESAETIRTPDYVIGLISTEQERNAGMIRIDDVANRHTQQFEACYIGAEFGCANFYSKPELNQ